MKWVIYLIALLMSSNALACTDGSSTRYYFFGVRPEGVEVARLLPVEIVRIDGQIVHARADERFAKALGGRDIQIELPYEAGGDNCIDYGIRDGRAFIVFVRVFTRSPGEIVVVARPVRGRVYPKGLSAAELDKYIVDPEMKALAERGRENR
ncbi:hypothetical protein K9B35_15195 [Sphingomonas sp. R647]|uniref:hypothetical protein n=1 Tax=Sphingomonas sp. R647 TaxID=2875233 RepID=UPI001CD71B69|nr:hypothetical protein [Sphingomonas sp. R647]MCA1199315.1 hypothetical protein [Sphingomonas sp. R647]